MRTAQKFLFDTSFDDESEADPAPTEPEAVEEPTITAEDLVAARSEGFALGHAAGVEEERSATSRMHAIAAEKLAAHVAGFDGALQEVTETAPREAIAIALSVLRRILPDYVRREGVQEIEAILRECLRELIDEPRLVLRVGEAAFDAVNEILTPVTTRAGFAGRVVLLADETLAESDCLVEWADGGVERSVARTWREIDETVKRILAMPQGAASDRATAARDDLEPGAGGVNEQSGE